MQRHLVINSIKVLVEIKEYTNAFLSIIHIIINEVSNFRYLDEHELHIFCY